MQQDLIEKSAQYIAGQESYDHLLQNAFGAGAIGEGAQWSRTLDSQLLPYEDQDGLLEGMKVERENWSLNLKKSAMPFDKKTYPVTLGIERGRVKAVCLHIPADTRLNEERVELRHFIEEVEGLPKLSKNVSVFCHFEPGNASEKLFEVDTGRGADTARFIPVAEKPKAFDETMNAYAKSNDEEIAEQKILTPLRELKLCS